MDPRGYQVIGAIAACALAAIIFILLSVWNLPAPGDISGALTRPELARSHWGTWAI